VSDPSEDFAATFEASLKAKRLEKGQTIEGTIIDRRRGILRQRRSATVTLLAAVAVALSLRLIFRLRFWWY
jgi:hypothetical protein